MGRSDGPGKYDLAAESPRGSAKGGFMSGEECENARHEKGEREGEVSQAMDDTEMTLPRILEEVDDFICRNVSEERESSASSPEMPKVIELLSERVETAITRYSSGSRLGRDEDGLSNLLFGLPAWRISLRMLPRGVMARVLVS
ncbi:hypothetical protein MLD38_011846 [Melastoma candidum]|uniref:Uncharacterized protein n=1 Tax=Melastoma candidum TaxID=119954 RepID=A0ACB9RCQ5_9MYRT|nr:hypothetical protein MLD38_011846 [Melastoma candidum]